MQPVKEIDVRFSAETWAFGEDFSGEVEAYWNRAKHENANLWNGRVLVSPRLRLNHGRLSGALISVEFAAFLCWLRTSRDVRFGYNLFGCTVIKGSDGALVYGKMAGTTANPGQIYPPGGTPDEADITEDGSVDMLRSIERELHEETGLRGEDGRSAGFFLVRDGVIASLCHIVQYPETAERIRSRMLDHNARLTDPELSDAVVIGRDDDLDRPNIPHYARMIAKKALSDE